MSFALERQVLPALVTVALALFLPGRTSAQARASERQQGLGQQTTGQIICQDSSGSQTSTSSTGGSSASSTTTPSMSTVPSATSFQRRQQLLAQLQTLNQQQVALTRQYLIAQRLNRR
jgi:hypothetical protein